MTPSSIRALLGAAFLACAYTLTGDVSPEYAAAKAEWEAKNREVRGYVSTVYRLRNATAHFDIRRQNIAKDLQILREMQSGAASEWSSDVRRARVQQVLKIIGTVDTVANVQTLNLKKMVQDQIMGAAQDALFEQFLEANGCSQKMVDLNSTVTQKLPEVEQLRNILSADLDSLKKATADTSGSWFVSERTDLLLRQHEIVDAALTKIIGSLEDIDAKTAQAIETAKKTEADLRPLWEQVHAEQMEIERQLDALKTAEEEQLLEVVEAEIAALVPPPPTPAEAPEPPIMEPEVTLQQKYDEYVEWYEWGINELNYYIPDWQAEVTAINAQVLDTYGDIHDTLDQAGLLNGSGSVPYSIGLLFDVPQPDNALMEPGWGNDPPMPASLRYLADRYTFFYPMSQFYSTNGILNAYSSIHTHLSTLRKHAIRLETLMGNIASMEPLAKDVDSYWLHLGLNEYNASQDPPYDKSVYQAFLQMSYQVQPEINLSFLAEPEAQYQMDRDTAYTRVKWLDESLPLMKAAFDETLAFMATDLEDLNDAIRDYYAAFTAAENAADAYCNLLRQYPDWFVDTYDPPSYTDLDGNYRDTHDVEFNIYTLARTLLDEPINEGLAKTSTLRALILQAEVYALAYHTARDELLAAWGLIQPLYPHFDRWDGAARAEWQALVDAIESDPNAYPYLFVPIPNFTTVDSFSNIWNSGDNLDIGAFIELEELPVPELETVDAVTELIKLNNNAENLANAWSQLPFSDAAHRIENWVADRSKWFASQSDEWHTHFATWANRSTMAAREMLLSWHAYENGDPTKPTIIRQPESVRIEKGQPATFSIEVDGELFSCQWFRYVADDWGGSYYIIDHSFALDFTSEPLDQDTMFICKIAWGAAPDANDNVLYSDVVTADVIDGSLQAFEPTSIDFPTDGGSLRVQLTSTADDAPVDWTTRTSASWVSTKDFGKGSQSLDITAEPNSSGAPRSARITVGNAVLTVRQAFDRESYAAWVARTYPDRPANDPSLAPNADPDGDGLPNRIAHLTQPSDTSQRVLDILPASSPQSPPTAQFLVSKFADVDALDLAIQYTDATGTWHSAPAPKLPTGDAATHWIYQAPIPNANSSAPVFFRLTAQPAAH